VAVLPVASVDGPATDKEKELVTVIVAVPLLERSATLTAVTETPGGEMEI
jgi:hypothetical protein